ncbi:hypothetical protein L7F22_044676 [Adiantum nelumboides]|nr:hypothetical protein [Adiantum nelumboides]
MVKVEVEYGGAGAKEEEEEWKAAKLFMAKGPSATLQFLKEERKALLYALDAQAMESPFLSHETSAQPFTYLILPSPADKRPGRLSDPCLKHRQSVRLCSSSHPFCPSGKISVAPLPQLTRTKLPESFLILRRKRALAYAPLSESRIR